MPLLSELGIDPEQFYAWYDSNPAPRTRSTATRKRADGFMRRTVDPETAEHISTIMQFLADAHAEHKGRTSGTWWRSALRACLVFENAKFYRKLDAMGLARDVIDTAWTRRRELRRTYMDDLGVAQATVRIMYHYGARMWR